MSKPGSKRKKTASKPKKAAPRSTGSGSKSKAGGGGPFPVDWRAQLGVRGVAFAGITILLAQLAPWVWIGALASELSLYLVPVLMLCGGLCVAARRWVPAALGWFALLMAVMPLWPLMRSVNDAPGQGPHFTLATLGFDGEAPDHAAVSKWLRASEADVAVLTGVSSDMTGRIRRQGRYRAWTVRPESRGGDRTITILSAEPVVEPPRRHSDGAVRSLLKVGACEVALTAIEAPALWQASRASERRAFFDGLTAEAKAGRGDAQVWAGDFGGSLRAPGVGGLVRQADLRDSRRGRGRGATWPAGWGSLGLPRDHVLVGGWLNVRDRRNAPALEGGSHRPVIVDLQLSAPECARSPSSP